MKTLKYIALAALTISFAACTQDEDFIPQGDADAVKITANIGKLQTRVSYDIEGNTEFDEDDLIRVENTKRTTKNKATYTYDGSSWSTTETLVWNGSSTNQFEAWYPVGDYSSFSTFELPTDQSRDALITAADWMTATTGEIAIKPDNNTINLTFKHLLTKVTIEVTTWNGEYGGKAQTIKDARIYSLSTGIEKNDDGVAIDNVRSLTGIYPNPMVDGSSYTAIVCPGKYAGNDKIMTFRVNGEVNEHTVLAKNNTALTTEGLQPGKHYTFNLTVGKNTAVISSVSVIDWAQENIDGGVAEEVTE